MLRSVLRGVFAFLVGLSLVIWSNQAGEILLKALGVFLVLSAVITVVYGLATNSFVDLKGMSLITMASAILFLVVGLLLFFKTAFFMEFIGFVLGVILALYGLLQLVLAVRSSKGIKERFWFFLVPCLIFIAGVIFCFFPKANISVLCIIFGACLMVLGISEILMAFKVRALSKRLRAAAQQEADQMKQNQQTIEVEAIEPEPEAEVSDIEPAEPAFDEPAEDATEADQ